MRQEDKSLNVLKTLEESVSETVKLLPKGFWFSIVIFLPLFITHIIVLLQTGDFYKDVYWSALAAHIAGFVLFYICGEFLRKKDVRLQDMISFRILIWFFLTSALGFILMISLIFPKKILFFSLIPSEQIDLNGPMAQMFSFAFSGFFGFLYMFLSSAIIWFECNLLNVWGYCFKITRGLRLPLLGVIAINIFICLVLGTLGMELDSLVAGFGSSAQFAKSCYNFLVMVFINVFTALFVIKIFMQSQAQAFVPVTPK